MNGSESLKNQAISKAKGAISSGGTHKNGKGQMKKRKQEVLHPMLRLGGQQTEGLTIAR